MATSLLTDNIWPRLSTLARRHRGIVAVPYFGRKGSKLLPLRRRSVLVVDCSESCVRGGRVDPNQLLTLHDKGVEIHCLPGLHAKVYVFGSRAVVGSANVSSASEKDLVEAGVETSDRRTVRACRSFVLSLCRYRMTRDALRKLVAIYEPPRVGSRRRAPLKRPLIVRPKMWAVPLDPMPYDQDEKAHAAVARSQAIQLADTDNQSLDDFTWIGKAFLTRLRRGELVVMCTRVGRQVWISPPAQVLAVSRYTHRRRFKGVVAVGVPKSKRARELKRVIALVGSGGGSLGRLRNPTVIRDRKLSAALGQLWLPGR